MRWMVIALLAAVQAAACDRAEPGGPLPNPTPPARVAVGPIPGPASPAGSQGPLATHLVNPYANDRGAMGEGRILFVRFNCSGCHGGRAGGGMGPSLRDVDWIYGRDDAQIFSSIAEGRAHGMPAWGVKLNDEQVWKLVAYIKSLRTPNEIQPPT
jgi:cytochrome c oxidase cbb3-type subunit III